MRVKPNPNKKVGKEKIKVFDPVRREFLPENGRDVPKTAYWIRRLQVGDVVSVDDKAEAGQPTPQNPAAPKAGKSKKSGAPKANKPKAAKTKAKESPEAPKEPEKSEAKEQPASNKE